MKLFRRTHWKPKQKLRKEDLPFLLAEYRISNTTSHISLTLFVSLLGIAIATYFMVGSNPDIGVRVLITSCVWASFVFLSSFFYFARKASRIAELLKIEKRLERYGIETKKEAEVTAPLPKSTLPTSQSTPRTQNVGESGGENIERAFDFLVMPTSFIIPLIWVALFSYLSFASFSSQIKTNLAEAFLVIILVKISLFIAILLLRCAGYFRIRGSTFLTQISFRLLVGLLFLAPLPLATLLVIVGELSIIYIYAYFFIVSLGPIFVYLIQYYRRSHIREKRGKT